MLRLTGGAMTPRMPANDWRSSIATSTRSYAIAGYVTLIAFVAGFGYWAAAAPLAGAVIAPGVVAAAGQNVSVQHLEGGIVDEIHVQEGERIEAGEPMLVLDPTIAEAQLNRLVRQSVALEAKAKRLEAERDGLDDMTLPPELASAPPELGALEVIEEQRREFQARLSRFRSELQILNQSAAALEAAVSGLEAQKAAAEDQLRVIDQEVDRQEDLLERGLATRSEYTILLRSQAELVGQVGLLQSQIASSSSQMVEAQEQIERLKTSRVEEALSELNTVRANLADVEEQRIAAASVVERMMIRAPVDGIVVQALYNAAGGVVGPGTKVFELLPTSSGLLVEARVSPQDIDAVAIGQEARLRFTALDVRRTPEVPATVAYVGADSRVDDATREAFFQIRLELALPLPAGFSLEQMYPGMPVEAFIATGDRTFLEYLIKPIRDSFSRAFLET